MWNKVKKVNLPYLILAVLMAALLWFYVDATVKPDTRITVYNLDINFSGMEEVTEKGLMIADTKPGTISLTLTGPRATVSQLNRSNVFVKVDLSTQVKEAGRKKLEYTITYPSGVNMSNVKVTRSVSTIEADVVKHSNKTIRVEPKFSGSFAQGYFNDGEQFAVYPREITIQGEDSLVRDIDHAVVELDKTELSATWEGELPIRLVTEKGERIESTELELSSTDARCVFPVSYYKELPLKVEFLSGGGATEKMVKDLKVTPSTLRVSGTKEILDGLKSITLGEIDLGQVVTGFEEQMEIPFPAGVTSTEDKAEAKVSFTLSPNLVTKNVRATDIRLKNAPTDRKAEIVTKSLEVSVRGPKDSMELLRPEYLSVTADISGLSQDAEGEVEIPAQVKINGMSDLGVMGSYTVLVSLEIV